MILSKFNRLNMLVSCLLLLGAGAAQAQAEAVLVKRAAELREAPGEASRSLATLAPRAPVTRSGARQGAWIQVRTVEGVSGWVHMFDVGSAAAAATVSSGTGTNALRGLTSFFNKGSGQGATVTATSTVGIRGLGAEDLARAQPNPTAVVLAEALRQDADQARQFAVNASLSSRAVDALPAPAPVRQDNPSGFINNNN